MNPLPAISAASSAIGAAFQAVGSFFAWALHRSGLRNSPAMQKADAAQKAQDLKDQIVMQIKEGNIEALRRRGSH